VRFVARVAQETEKTARAARRECLPGEAAFGQQGRKGGEVGDGVEVGGSLFASEGAIEVGASPTYRATARRCSHPRLTPG
jgi:hypothetical protein